MITDLVSLGRIRWIIGWLIGVAVPSILALLFGPDENRLLIMAFVFLPTSYIYFWSLKLAVDTWTSTLSARLEYVRRELDREKDMSVDS